MLFQPLHRHPSTLRQRGFTLSEVLVTVAIVAIVSAVALPSMRDVVEGAKVSGRFQDLTASLMLARSEAVKRNATVTVCRSSTLTSCAASGVGDWRAGWITFLDADASGTRATAEEILYVRKGDTGGGPLVGTGTTADYIAYRSDGYALAAGGAAHAGAITACSTQATVKRQRLTFSAGSGAFRTSSLAGSTTCTGA